MNPFEGRVFLVSGASSGIGESVAAQLQQRGAIVYGVASNPKSVAEAKERHPAVRWLTADITKRAEVDAAVAKLLGETKRLDGLVNVAGIFQFAPFGESSEEMMRHQLDVNLFGTIYLTQASLASLRASKGAIVNVSSSAARRAFPNQAVYAASKGAVESLTRALAVELAPDGIRVNGISPGPTMTPGVGKIPMPPGGMEAARDHVLKLIPLGRLGTPDDVAHWCVALADPSSTWLTGQIIGVDGGM